MRLSSDPASSEPGAQPTRLTELSMHIRTGSLANMRAISLPLLARVVLALVAVGLLPFAISAYRREISDRASQAVGSA